MLQGETVPNIGIKEITGHMYLHKKYTRNADGMVHIIIWLINTQQNYWMLRVGFEVLNYIKTARHLNISISS